MSNLDLSKAKDITVIADRVCPFRSTAQAVPTPQGVGFAEFLAPCRRDCAIFDKDRGECSVKATGRPPIGMLGLQDRALPRESPGREKVRVKPQEINHYPVPKRKPIVLTDAGDALLPRKGVGGDQDALLADPCVGIHDVCGGSVSCVKTTVSGTLILFCTRCGLRLVYPPSVATFGDLRSMPLESFKTGADPSKNVRCAKVLYGGGANLSTCVLAPNHDGDCSYVMRGNP